MTTDQGQPASFWRETFRALIPFVKAEWQWISFFSAVMAIEEIGAIFYCNIPQIMQELNSVAPDLSKATSILTSKLTSILSYSVINFGTAGLATYWFTSLFLRHSNEPAAALTLSNFAYWLKNVLWKYVLLGAPLVVAGFLLEGIGRFLVGENRGALSYLAVAVFLVWIFYFYYGLYLFYLVSPLAVSGDASPLKTSAKMTREILLRVWWGSMVITIVVYCLVSPVFLIKIVMQDHFGLLAMKTQSISSLAEGIWMGTLTAATSVYACVVMRILRGQSAKNSLTTG